MRTSTPVGRLAGGGRFHVCRKLRDNPVVALLGARQVGKTTLATELAARRQHVSHFDLEDPRDLARLDEPTLSLESLRGLIVIDEVQHRPNLFPVLRVLADRSPLPARFLVLGSASPELLRQGSESLAGRIGYHELPGFDLVEVGVERLPRPDLVHGGPELDLLVVRGQERRGYEFKRTDAPRVTKSVVAVTRLLGLSGLDVVHVSRDTYPMADGVRAVAGRDILAEIQPL